MNARNRWLGLVLGGLVAACGNGKMRTGQSLQALYPDDCVAQNLVWKGFDGTPIAEPLTDKQRSDLNPVCEGPWELVACWLTNPQDCNGKPTCYKPAYDKCHNPDMPLLQQGNNEYVYSPSSLTLKDALTKDLIDGVGINELRCTTCDDIPLTSPERIRQKFDCLYKRLVQYSDWLANPPALESAQGFKQRVLQNDLQYRPEARMGVLRKVRLLYEMYGSQLTDAQKAKAVDQYLSDRYIPDPGLSGWSENYPTCGVQELATTVPLPRC